MKLLNQLHMPVILLTILTQIVVMQGLLAAEIDVGEVGPTNFECKLGYCQCTGGSQSSDCKRMMINCTDLNSFGCHDVIDCPPGFEGGKDGCLKKNPKGNLCMCKTASDESTNPIVRDHRRPKIDTNSDGQAEIIAPNNRTGPVRVQRTRPSTLSTDNAPNSIVTDHRKMNGPVTIDHRRKSDTTLTDHRNKSDPNDGHWPKTSTEPSKNILTPSGLASPSGLVVNHITRTTLTLSWIDNSNREFGVELYRVDPVEARHNPANSWKMIGTFQERIQSNGTGTGMRSEEDFDLSPNSNYCYRMRAYRGFDRSEVSDYSEVVCTKTSP